MRKILVVEDDPSVAALVRHFLEGERYITVVTSEAEEGWSLLQSEPFDGAIVDLTLAGRWSGWDLVERCREDSARAGMPIVVCTGEPPDEVTPRIESLNCAYLAKPFSLAALLDRLQVAIKAAGNAPAQRALGVVMLTDRYRIEGSVHLPEDLARFSDAWEALVSDKRSFIPVTGASVYALDAATHVATTDLIEVRKEVVQVAFERPQQQAGASETVRLPES